MKIRTEIFDTYWYLAEERQKIFFNKIRGVSPLTLDPIFLNFKFCNAYRASDRVSQFLIKNVIYNGQKYSEADLLLRILLFRLLNKNETWTALENKIGEVKEKSFNKKEYGEALEEIKKQNGVIYGSAFILCANKAFGYDKKYQNHLSLLELIMRDSEKILKSKNLKSLFENLRDLPLIGNFMAYQMAIDLNYSPLFNFSENEFSVAGPGAIRGINKCFENIGDKSSEQIIMWMVENQEKEFGRLGLKFQNLWGRPLMAIDCQGLFCETDKYCRAKFPELISNRVRIKTKYQAQKEKIDYFYPPKWELNGKLVNRQ